MYKELLMSKVNEAAFVNNDLNCIWLFGVTDYVNTPQNYSMTSEYKPGKSGPLYSSQL